MTVQVINVGGAPGDHTGDGSAPGTGQVPWQKANANFSSLDTRLTAISPTALSYLNASTYPFSQTAIMLGAGSTQGVDFGGSGTLGLTPRMWGDPTGSLVTNMGSSGIVAIQSPGSSAALAVPGYDGTISISGAGRLINGHGAPQQLRGMNFAFADQLMGSSWTNNAGGIWFGYDGPTWPTLKTWGINCVRITMCAAAFLNVNMGVLASATTWSGALVKGDPNGIYKAQLLKLIQGARSIGAYIILDLHWTAPSFNLSGTTQFMGNWDQPPFIDSNLGLPFWTAATGAGPTDATTGLPSTGLVAWLQSNAINPQTGTINDILFELFNEPYFLNGSIFGATFNTQNGGGGTALTRQQLMATGGWVSIYNNQGDTVLARGGIGIPLAYRTGGVFTQWWQSPGYQAVLTGIRALGATNILICNTDSFAHQLADLPIILPTDTLPTPQVATGYHAYEFGTGNGWPYAANGAGDTGGNGTSTAYYFPNLVMAGNSGVGRAIPVITTEYAPSNGAGAGTPQPSVFMVNQHVNQDSQPPGSNGSIAWTYAPLVAGFGAGVQNQLEAAYSANITFTGAMSGTTTLTVSTSPAGGSLGAGTVLTNGGSVANNSSFDRPYIVAQISGTPGGIGAYQMSSASTFAASSMTANNVFPINGQGLTDFNWMSTHTASVGFGVSAPADSAFSAATGVQTLATVPAAATIVMVVQWNSGGATLTGVSDGTPYVQKGTTVTSSGSSVALFVLQNASGGSHTITATFSAATTGTTSAYFVTGAVAVDPTGFASVDSPFAGTTPNGIAGAGVSPTSGGCIILSHFFTVSGSGVLTPGTSPLNWTNLNFATTRTLGEYYLQTTPALVIPTATSSSSSDILSVTLALMPKSGSNRFTVDQFGNVNLPAGGSYQISSTQVVGPQITGYGTPTGGVNQGSFAAGAITLPNLAAGYAQLILDLKKHGIIGT